MALLKKKTEDTTETASGAKAQMLTRHDLILQPRLSEKSAGLAKIDKYVFTVRREANKPEVRKALEKLYGITIDRVNMVKMEGKARRYGKAQGRTRGFKKAIVTLTKDSKKPEVIEAA